MRSAVSTLQAAPLLHDLLRRCFGAQVQIVATTIANQRHDYMVLLAELRRPTLHISIKLAGPDAALVGSLDRSAALHRLVAARTSIVMPEILAVDTSCVRWPWRYLIKTMIPGQEWAVIHPQLSAAERRAAMQQIAQAVAELHAITWPAFGELNARGALEREQALLPALIEHAQRIVRLPRARDLFLDALDTHADVFADVARASLCHEDLHGHNLLFQRQQGVWRLATILDFDKTWAGHHESDLARLDLWTDMADADFWAAYRALHPVAASYHARRPIYQLLWCLEYAAATPRHLADTNRVCAELGLPPIERFE
jgi:hypothetical protein